MKNKTSDKKAEESLQNWLNFMFENKIRSFCDFVELEDGGVFLVDIDLLGHVPIVRGAIMEHYLDAEKHLREGRTTT